MPRSSAATLIAADGIPCSAPPGATEVVVSIGEGVLRAVVALSASVERLQVTGVQAVGSLEISGPGVSIVLFASSAKRVGLLHLNGVVAECVDISPERVVLEPDEFATGITVASEARVSELRARSGLYCGVSEALRVALIAKPSASLIERLSATPGGGESVCLDKLFAPSLCLVGRVLLEVGDWTAAMGMEGVVSTVGDGGHLRFTAAGPEGGLFLQCDRACVEVVNGALLAVRGRARTLRTQGAAIVSGTSLSVDQLRCDEGAKLSGLEVGSLDPASLTFAMRGVTFDVNVPTDHSWRSFMADATTGDWWNDASSWRQLYELLEQKGQPGSARWARTMEREARRRAATNISVQRFVLEIARFLGYGESVLRPLLAHLAVVIVALALVSLGAERSWMALVAYLCELFPRLLFSPIGLVNGSLFIPISGDSSSVQIAWLLCALSGTVCFATAALAARRTLAYDS